jgi:hypothetical protein
MSLIYGTATHPATQPLSRDVGDVNAYSLLTLIKYDDMGVIGEAVEECLTEARIRDDLGPLGEAELHGDVESPRTLHRGWLARREISRVTGQRRGQRVAVIPLRFSVDTPDASPRARFGRFRPATLEIIVFI